MLSAKYISALPSRDVDFTICGGLKIVLFSGQLDLAMLAAKLNFASVCRAAYVATFHRAAHCALVCEVVTIDLTGAGANLGLQPRRSVSAILLYIAEGSILLRQGKGLT